MLNAQFIKTLFPLSLCASVFIFFFIATPSFSQSLPEQDCISAIPICQNTYVSTTSYSGQGNIPNEINPLQSCLSSGEKNDVWYIFSPQTSGSVSFLITPFNPQDDYDWAVFNLTGKTCSQIFSDTSMEVSCNYDANIGCGGVTGPNGLQSGCGQTEPVIPVSAGEIYVVNVSNYSSSQNGYTIDFSTSTANIFDNTPPPKVFLTADCTQDSVVLSFSEAVSCNSIATDGSDFIIADNNGEIKNIFSAAGNNCTSTSIYTSVITVKFNDRLSISSNYFLIAQNGNDGNTIADKCDNFFTADDTLAYITTQNTLTANLGNDILFCADDAVLPQLQLPYLNEAIYRWNLNGQNLNVTSNQVRVAEEGIYDATISFGNNCTATDTVVANYKPVVSFSLGNDIIACENNVPVLNPFIAAQGNFLWAFNNSYLSNAQFVSASQSGEYILEFSSSSTCRSSDTVYVDIKKIPVTPEINCPLINGNENIFSWNETPNAQQFYVSESNGASWIPANGADGLSHHTSLEIKQILLRAAGDFVCTLGQEMASEICGEETPVTISVNGQVLLTVSGFEIPLQLEITDALGRNVFFSGDYRNNWSANNLSGGIYCYRLRSGKARFESGKFFIGK